MSMKGEKYTSMAMKKKHEMMEGAKERKMEYGSKIKTKPMKKGKKPSMVKRAGKK